MKPLLQKLRPAAPAALAALIAATLAGCATSADGVASGSPKLAVRIPETCERLAEAVPLPEIRAGDDARAQVARHRSGLVTANRRIGATRNCQARQRERFARGGAK